MTEPLNIKDLKPGTRVELEIAAKNGTSFLRQGTYIHNNVVYMDEPISVDETRYGLRTTYPAYGDYEPMVKLGLLPLPRRWGCAAPGTAATYDTTLKRVIEPELTTLSNAKVGDRVRMFLDKNDNYASSKTDEAVELTVIGVSAMKNLILGLKSNEYAPWAGKNAARGDWVKINEPERFPRTLSLASTRACQILSHETQASEKQPELVKEQPAKPTEAPSTTPQWKATLPANAKETTLVNAKPGDRVRVFYESSTSWNQSPTPTEHYYDGTVLGEDDHYILIGWRAGEKHRGIERTACSKSTTTVANFDDFEYAYYHPSKNICYILPPEVKDTSPPQPTNLAPLKVKLNDVSDNITRTHAYLKLGETYEVHHEDNGHYHLTAKPEDGWRKARFEIVAQVKEPIPTDKSPKIKMVRLLPNQVPNHSDEWSYMKAGAIFEVLKNYDGCYVLKGYEHHTWATDRFEVIDEAEQSMPTSVVATNPINDIQSALKTIETSINTLIKTDTTLSSEQKSALATELDKLMKIDITKEPEPEVLTTLDKANVGDTVKVYLTKNGWWSEYKTDKWIEATIISGSTTYNSYIPLAWKTLPPEGTWHKTATFSSASKAIKDAEATKYMSDTSAFVGARIAGRNNQCVIIKPAPTDLVIIDTTIEPIEPEKSKTETAQEVKPPKRIPLNEVAMGSKVKIVSCDGWLSSAPFNDLDSRLSSIEATIIGKDGHDVLLGFEEKPASLYNVFASFGGEIKHIKIDDASKIKYVRLADDFLLCEEIPTPPEVKEPAKPKEEPKEPKPISLPNSIRLRNAKVGDRVVVLLSNGYATSENTGDGSFVATVIHQGENQTLLGLKDSSEVQTGLSEMDYDDYATPLAKDFPVAKWTSGGAACTLIEAAKPEEAKPADERDVSTATKATVIRASDANIGDNVRVYIDGVQGTPSLRKTDYSFDATVIEKIDNAVLLGFSSKVCLYGTRVMKDAQLSSPLAKQFDRFVWVSAAAACEIYPQQAKSKEQLPPIEQAIIEQPLVEQAEEQVPEATKETQTNKTDLSGALLVLGGLAGAFLNTIMTTQKTTTRVEEQVIEEALDEEQEQQEQVI